MPFDQSGRGVSAVADGDRDALVPPPLGAGPVDGGEALKAVHEIGRVHEGRALSSFPASDQRRLVVAQRLWVARSGRRLGYLIARRPFLQQLVRGGATAEAAGEGDDIGRAHV